MDSLRWWARDGDAMRQAIAWGESAHRETASAACTDAFLLVAMERGLWQTWAEAFPAPRREPEVGLEVLWPAHRAARFAGVSSRRQAGDVRRSARGLGAWGDSAEGSEPPQGWSWRGPADDQLFRGDVGRTLLGPRAPPADLSPAAWLLPPQEPSGAVQGRQRAARRAVTQAGEVAEAEARAPWVAAPWVDWSNQPVGVSLGQSARLGRGRRMHRRATTHVAGA
jgi:hypothetical protein